MVLCAQWNLISQILFQNSHFSNARNLYPFGMLHSPAQILFPKFVREREIRRLQRVGLPTFHPCSIAVWLQAHDRLCGSLIPAKRGIVSFSFQKKNTRPFSAVLTHSPLTFSCLDFPPRFNRGENSDSNVPNNYIILYNYGETMEKFNIFVSKKI